MKTLTPFDAKRQSQSGFEGNIGSDR